MCVHSYMYMGCVCHDVCVYSICTWDVGTCCGYEWCVCIWYVYINGIVCSTWYSVYTCVMCIYMVCVCTWYVCTHVYTWDVYICVHGICVCVFYMLCAHDVYTHICVACVYMVCSHVCVHSVCDLCTWYVCARGVCTYEYMCVCTWCVRV